MTYTERVRNWAKTRGVKLHERVLGDGQHHVWCSLWAGRRIDVEGRDFELVMRLVWSRVVARVVIG